MSFSPADLLFRPWVLGVGHLSPFHRTERQAVARRRSAGVHCYVGKNGSGKSMLASLDTLPALRGIPWSCDNRDHLHTIQGQTTGTVRVLSTMRFRTRSGADHPLWIPLDSYDKLLTAEHCEIILDEAGGAVASTSNAADDLPFPVKAVLQEQRRKENLIRLTAPGWMRVTKTAREVVGLVTEVTGRAPVRIKSNVVVDGPHEMEVYNDDTEELERFVCRLPGVHEHDAQRQWGSRRLMIAKTYDAQQFDEFKAGTKAKESSQSSMPKPYVRHWFWRPGSRAETAYDTFAYVYKLGQVTQGGICMVCDRPKKRETCKGGHSPEDMTRALVAKSSTSDQSESVGNLQAGAAAPEREASPDT